VSKFFRKYLSVYGVLDFKHEKYEDNCLVRQDQKGFQNQKEAKTLKTKIKKLKENDLHCISEIGTPNHTCIAFLLFSRDNLDSSSIKNFVFDLGLLFPIYIYNKKYLKLTILICKSSTNPTCLHVSSTFNLTFS